MTDLKGQIALVTGASGGIGGAVALSLANEAAGVCIVGRNQFKLDALATKMLCRASHVHVCPTDLTCQDQVGRLVDHVKREYGRLDILVQSAGGISYGRLEDAPLEHLDQQYRANVRGPFTLTQLLLPFLKKPRGQIVMMNSSVGLIAKSNAGYYSATQHAIKALADSLRDEVNREGVRVLSIFPGRTATARTEAYYAMEGWDYQPELLLQPEDVAQIILCALKLPWTAEVTNISIRPMLKTY